MASIVKGGLNQDKKKKKPEDFSNLGKIDHRISFDKRNQNPAEQAKLQKLFLKYGGTEVISAPKSKVRESEARKNPSGSEMTPIRPKFNELPGESPAMEFTDEKLVRETPGKQEWE